MSMRMTDFLGYLSLFAILAAIWLLFGEDPRKYQGGRGEAYFLDFEPKVSGISTIRLQTANQQLTLVKKDADWVIADDPLRFGYPIPADTVNAILQGMATVQRLQPKTMNPARFDQLDLDAAQALFITMLAKDGSTVVDFRLGKRRLRAGKALGFAYQPSDTRAWMVDGLPDITGDLQNWIESPLYRIDLETIQSVTLMDGTVINQQVDSSKLSETMQAITMPVALDVMKRPDSVPEPLAALTITPLAGPSHSIKIYDINGQQWIEFSAALSGWLYQLSAADLRLLLRKRSDLVENKTIS